MVQCGIGANKLFGTPAMQINAEIPSRPTLRVSIHPVTFSQLSSLQCPNATETLPLIKL